MKYEILKALSQKLYFTACDAAQALGIRCASAHVECNRYVRSGIFIRIKRNVYVTAQGWDVENRQKRLMLANFLQVPSYVSLMTALAHYEATSQMHHDFWESASLKRSKKINVKDAEFRFYKLAPKYYFGFVKKDDFFIATPEKALVDAVYLASFGKYSFDCDSIDRRKIDWKKVITISKVFPARTQEVVRKICKI